MESSFQNEKSLWGCVPMPAAPGPKGSQLHLAVSESSPKNEWRSPGFTN